MGLYTWAHIYTNSYYRTTIDHQVDSYTAVCSYYRAIKDLQVEAKENLIDHIGVVTESSALDLYQLMAVSCVLSSINIVGVLISACFLCCNFF